MKLLKNIIKGFYAEKCGKCGAEIRDGNCLCSVGPFGG